MNITNMQRLQRHLELDGQAFDYSCFVGNRLEDGSAEELEGESDEVLQRALKDLYHCGGETVGCLAGMAAAIATQEDGWLNEKADGDIIDIVDIAEGWLELTANEADALFYGYAMSDQGWYTGHGQAMDNATPNEAAKIVQIWIDEGGDPFHQPERG